MSTPSGSGLDSSTGSPGWPGDSAVFHTPESMLPPFDLTPIRSPNTWEPLVKGQYEDEDEVVELDAISPSERSNRNRQPRFFDDLQHPPTQYQEYQSLQGLEPQPCAPPKLEQMQGSACVMQPNAWSSTATSHFPCYTNPPNAMLGAGEVSDQPSASGLLEQHPVPLDSWMTSGLSVQKTEFSLSQLPATSTAGSCSQSGFETWIADTEYQPHESQPHGLTAPHAVKGSEVPSASIARHGYYQEMDITEHIHLFNQSSGPPATETRTGTESTSHFVHQSSSLYPDRVRPVADMQGTDQSGCQRLERQDKMTPPFDVHKGGMAASFASGQLDTTTPLDLGEGLPPNETAVSDSHHHAMISVKRDLQILDDDEVWTPIKKEEVGNSDVDLDLSDPFGWEIEFLFDEEWTTLRRANDSKSSPKQVAESKKRKRGKVRRKIARPREWKACMRCGMQKIKCIENREGLNLPCLTCLFYNRESSKTIHTLPCHRTRILSVSLYRTNNLRFTKRFPQTKVVDIKTFGKVRTIEMDGAICETPMVLKLRRFIPVEGDQLGRRYADSKGRVREVYKLPYCLADVNETASTFKHYIRLHVLNGLLFISRREPELIRRTMEMAVEHMRYLNFRKSQLGPESALKTSQDEINFKRTMLDWQLLWQTLQIWYAIRHAYGSAYLRGEETLGMVPITDPDCPFLNDGIPVPRMISAQFDAIRLELFYKPYLPVALESYQNRIRSLDPQSFFTIYLTTFLLLDLVPVACHNGLRQRRQHAMETRYGAFNNEMTFILENVQEGGITLLSYWYYYKRVNLFEVDWRHDSIPAGLEGLTPRQLQHMKWTVEELKRTSHEIPKTPESGCWEDQRFWFAEMFRPSNPRKGYEWSPPEIFSRAKPSVGREPWLVQRVVND